MAQAMLVGACAGGASTGLFSVGLSIHPRTETEAFTHPASDNHSMWDTVAGRADAEEIIKRVEGTGLGRIATRLLELHEICMHDPDESDIDLESLSTLASFLNEHGATLPEPRVSVSPYGSLVAEWKMESQNMSESGVVAIEFLRNDRVRFVAFGATKREKGTKRLSAAYQAVQPFFERS